MKNLLLRGQGRADGLFCLLLLLLHVLIVLWARWGLFVHLLFWLCIVQFKWLYSWAWSNSCCFYGWAWFILCISPAEHYSVHAFLRLSVNKFLFFSAERCPIRLNVVQSAFLKLSVNLFQKILSLLINFLP